MKRSTPYVPRIFLIAVFISICIAILIAYQIRQSYKSLWLTAEVTNQNLLLSVSSVLQRTLNITDLGLQHTAFHLGRTDVDLNHSSQFSSLLFRAKAQEGVGLEIVLNEHANVLLSSDPDFSVQANFSDRDYFKTHLLDSDSGLFIGAPIVSRIDGELSLPLSRRWHKPDGSFGGVVVQTIKINSWVKLFSEINLGPHNGLNAYLRNGTAIIIFPYTESTKVISLAGTPNFNRYLLADSGSFKSVSPIDSTQRFYNFKALDGHPIILSTVQSTKSLLFDWRVSTVWQIGVSLLFIIVCLVLAKRIERILYIQRVTSQRLTRTQRNIRTILGSIPAMVAYWGADYRNRFANNEHKKWFNLAPNEIRGKKLNEIIGAELFEQIKPAADNALLGWAQQIELTVTNKDGSVSYLAGSFIPDAPAGQTNGFFALLTDITQLKTAENRLYQEKERFRVTLDSIRDGVIATDKNGLISYLNPAAELFIGLPPEQAYKVAIDQAIQFKEIQNLSGAMPRLPILKALEQGRFVSSGAEHIILNKKGETVHVEASAAPIFDENQHLVGAVMVLHNVSEARAKAMQMERLAQHDALTGLPNRRLLTELGAKSIARASRLNKLVGVLFLDLDGFKRVNDTLGHSGGDKLLIEVGKRLLKEMRLTDTLARNGGDELIVLMSEVNTIDEAVLLADRLIKAFKDPFIIDSNHVSITVSIGVSIYPSHALLLEELINYADQAMYQAKESGRNQYCIYGK